MMKNSTFTISMLAPREERTSTVILSWFIFFVISTFMPRQNGR